jgi:hypothetical protein
MASMLGRKRGRVLAVKWGLNPNSSSLGVDVTFLLVGATALSMATPFVSALVRLRASKRTLANKSNETSPDESLASS